MVDKTVLSAEIAKTEVFAIVYFPSSRWGNFGEIGMYSKTVGLSYWLSV